MPPIPLGLKAYRRLANFEPEVELVNLFIEKDESGASPDNLVRLVRPGLYRTEIGGTGATRGLFRQSGFFNGDRFKVVGTVLYRNQESLGSVAGSDLVAWAGGIGYLFVLAGGTLYVTDGETVDVVTLPDGVTPVDIDGLNSYVFVGFSDGSVYWIVPGENEIDPLNFITAEGSPDGLVAVRRLQSELFLFGTTSIEPWQLTGNADAVIQKAVGRQYERGCLSRDTVRRFDNSLMWVGENGNVYRAGANPEVVADEGISERIRLRSGELSAMVLGFDRHEFYALRIPGQGTFLLDAAYPEGWCRWQTDGMDEWEPYLSIYDDSGVFLAGPRNRIWRPDFDSALDDVQFIEWRVTGNVTSLGRPVRNDGFAVMVGSSADINVRFRWRDADEPFPDYYDDMVFRAPADVATFYRLGAVRPPYRSYELSGASSIRVRISGASTEAWQ